MLTFFSFYSCIAFFPKSFSCSYYFSRLREVRDSWRSHACRGVQVVCIASFLLFLPETNNFLPSHYFNISSTYILIQFNLCPVLHYILWKLGSNCFGGNRIMRHKLLENHNKIDSSMNIGFRKEKRS